MKFLTRLEKTKLFWSVLALVLIFFLLRLPSIIEPYWYGDEGIYHVIGQAMHNGQLLYRDIWDNKPPLLYSIYAYANGDQMLVRFISLIVGFFSVVTFYLLSIKLFSSERISFVTTLIYVLLFATPILEGNIANAENFILLPILFSAWFVVRFAFDPHRSKENKKSGALPLLAAGFLIGTAFLFKIVAIFDLAAFALFLLLHELNNFSYSTLKKTLIPIFSLVFGFLIPFSAAAIYFAMQGILIDYLQGAFAGNVDYVGFENSLFGIPQGLLLIKILSLVIALLLIVVKRKSFSKVSLFITLWTIFALFNANFSGRPYTHYLLVMLPSFCLLIGLALSKKSLLHAKAEWITIAVITLVTLFTFPTYGIGKTFAYYQTTIQFLNGNTDVRSYYSFFDSKTPRDYAIASFLSQNTDSPDKVFIWGDSAQIYTLSDKLPPYKYTVSYHVKTSEALIKETQEAINEAKPKYIVVLPESQPLPFSVPLYIIRFNVDGAIIYERSI
jgi:hypothetical protein